MLSSDKTNASKADSKVVSHFSNYIALSEIMQGSYFWYKLYFNSFYKAYYVNCMFTMHIKK